MKLNPGILLNKLSEDYGEKVAVVYKNEKITYETLNKRANRLANGLIDAGLQKGDKVGVFLGNTPEFMVAYFAIQKAGGVAVPFDIRVSYAEMKNILSFAEAKFMITSPQSELPLFDSLINVNIKGDDIFINEKQINPKSLPVGVDKSEDDEAVYLLTSGSTGKPKLAVLTLRNLQCFPMVMEDVFKIKEKFSEVYGMLLPMSHVSGPIICQELVYRGGTIVLFDRLDGDFILQSIEDNKISFTWGVVPIFSVIMQALKKKNFNISSLNCLAVMGMETPLYFLQELTNAFPNAAIIQGYGLTETAGPITGVSPKDFLQKLGSIGKAASFMDVKIVDNNGNFLKTGEYGEIVIKGPAVMKGYFKNEELTKEIIKDGWLHTKDVGYYDEDGYFYIAGRKDDMIITGGLNVFPVEIEEVLLKHPDVREVAVVGVPDEKRGAIIEAVIAPKSDNISKQEILKYCKLHLAEYKCPKRIRFMESLPKTTSGKISRSALRNMQ